MQQFCIHLAGKIIGTKSVQSIMLMNATDRTNCITAMEREREKVHKGVKTFTTGASSKPFFSALEYSPILRRLASLFLCERLFKWSSHWSTTTKTRPPQAAQTNGPAVVRVGAEGEGVTKGSEMGQTVQPSCSVCNPKALGSERKFATICKAGLRIFTAHSASTVVLSSLALRMLVTSRR